MGNALLLAAITTTLRNLLENGLVKRGVAANIGADLTISALPPDRIATGEDEKAQLNLFLYQVTPIGLFPFSRAASTEADRAYSAPASLELQYLLTAYSAEDLQAEILLGHALELLHETPVLTGEELRAIVTSASSAQGGRGALHAVREIAKSDLTEYIANVKIFAHFMNTEQMVSLWSTLKAGYRPTLVYKVTIYLKNPKHEAEKA